MLKRATSHGRAFRRSKPQPEPREVHTVVAAEAPVEGVAVRGDDDAVDHELGEGKEGGALHHLHQSVMRFASVFSVLF